MAKVLQRLDILLFANTAQYRSEMRETQESTTTIFGAIKSDAANMAKVGAAAFAGMAVAGTAAIGVMIKEQIELGVEITALAKVSNTGVESMQKLAIAAKDVGVEQATLGDIYKDTQDKVGDFLSTGGGAMADYFENVAPLIGQTADQFRDLSGPDALQLYYNGLQQANLSQSELVFYMEGIASDASLLIPLLHDAGAGFDVWAEAAENAGAIMSEETITATMDLQAANDLMMLSYEGAKKQFTQAFIPVLADVANNLVGSSDAADIARQSGEFLVKTFKVMAATGLGVVAVVKAIGKAIGGMGAILAQYANITDGVDFSSPFAFFQLAKNAIYDIPTSQIAVLRDVVGDITSDFTTANRQMTAIYALGNGSADNQYITAAANQRELRNQYGLTGQAYQAQQTAAEDAAKSAEKAAAKVAKLAKAQSLIPKAASDAILAGAKQLGVNPNDLAAVISFETSGSFRTDIRNPTSSATGLIQFMQNSDGKDDGKYFGMTRTQFGNLLPLQQMEYVVKYLKGRGIGAGSGVGEIYDAVAGYGYKRGTESYRLNQVWDVNKDGVVAKGEAVTGKRFKAHIKDYYGDGVAIAQQSISQINMDEQRAAAKQARIAEQQSKDRTAIRYEYANKVVQIETQLANELEKIKASGFNADEAQAFSDDARQRAAIELANYEDTQAKKVAAFGDFMQSERDLVTQNAIYRATEVIRDETLTQDQRDQALEFIKQKAQYEINQLDLTHDQQMQYAMQAEQTDIERITNQYALERREIQLTINMDEQLRKAKIDALNQSEELALSERTRAYESELRQITSIGQSELIALRQSYADQRRVLDARTDIDDGQKSNLRNAMAGAQIYDTNQLQNGARDAFDSQQAGFDGNSEQYGLQQQLKQQLDIIENAKKAELLTVETYEKAKFDAQRTYQEQSNATMLSSAQSQFGGVTELMRMAFGEQNALYQGAFIFQKGLAIAQALLNIPKSYSQAFNAVVGIPIVGPVLAPAAGVAAAALQVAQKAMIEKVQPPSMPGFEVGGYTGRGGTSDVAGLVHKEEFVANAPTTRKYRPELEAMHNGTYERDNGNAKTKININIINNAPVDVSTSVNSNGDIDMHIDQRMAKQLPGAMAAQVNQSGSPVNKALINNYQMERRF